MPSNRFVHLPDAAEALDAPACRWVHDTVPCDRPEHVTDEMVAARTAGRKWSNETKLSVVPLPQGRDGDLRTVQAWYADQLTTHEQPEGLLTSGRSAGAGKRSTGSFWR